MHNRAYTVIQYIYKGACEGAQICTSISSNYTKSHIYIYIYVCVCVCHSLAKPWPRWPRWPINSYPESQWIPPVSPSESQWIPRWVSPANVKVSGHRAGFAHRWRGSHGSDATRCHEMPRDATRCHETTRRHRWILGIDASQNEKSRDNDASWLSVFARNARALVFSDMFRPLKPFGLQMERAAGPRDAHWNGGYELYIERWRDSSGCNKL